MLPQKKKKTKQKTLGSKFGCCSPVYSPSYSPERKKTAGQCDTCLWARGAGVFAGFLDTTCGPSHDSYRQMRVVTLGPYTT